MQFRAELEGRFKLDISGGARGNISYDWFPNLILDEGVRHMMATAQGSNAIAFCAVGSSSAPVDVSQSGVISLVARSALDRTNPTYGWNASGEYNWNIKTIRFVRGAAAGNISEIAMEIANSSNIRVKAWCRALVKDSLGNPATITVLSDEVLTVTYELRRWFIPPAPHDITFDNDGEPFTTTVSYLQNKNLNNVFIASSLDGSAVEDGFSSVKSQVFSESVGNPTILKSNLLGRLDSFFPDIANYATFTPPIPKTSEFTVSIEQTFTLARRV